MPTTTLALLLLSVVTEPDPARLFAESSIPRVVVFGNSGSGKTTLARELTHGSERAHLDLDDVAWIGDAPEPTRRPLEESRERIEAFLRGHDRWVVEGSYGSLVEFVAPHADELVFLNPGVAACQANCRRRPWEEHKYASPQEQDARLEFLLDWVARYEERDDEFSLAAHRRLYDGHPGAKRELTSAPRYRSR